MHEVLQGKEGLITRVLVMGCTPSIRKLLEQHFPSVLVYCADFSTEMYSATSESMGKLNPNETLIATNWLDLGAAMSEPVDVVIGDKAIDNVPFDRWSELFTQLAGVLAPQGLLVAHVGLPDPGLKGTSFAVLVHKWEQLVALGAVPVDDAVTGLWEDLLSASATDSHRDLSLRPFVDDIRQLASARATSSPLEAGFLDMFQDVIVGTWTRFDQQDVETAASVWFDLARTDHSADYLAAPQQPILTFRKRSRALT